MTRYCNRESRENREERALSASGAPCLYIYIPMYIEYICTIQCTRQGATHQSTGQPILHSAYTVLVYQAGERHCGSASFAYTSIGRIWTEKMQGRGREKEEDGAKRASENDAQEGGGGIWGGRGGRQTTPQKFYALSLLFQMAVPSKLYSKIEELEIRSTFFVAVIMNWWPNFQTKS